MLYTNCYVTLNLKPLRNLISCKKENTLCQALSYSSLYTRELKVMVLYQPFQNRTIPPAFRRVSVCVCLVGFASLQSPWAHTLKASLPCLLLPLHRTFPFPQPLQKGNNPSKIAKCINLNSEPEKCCPINRTIGSLLS